MFRSEKGTGALLKPLVTSEPQRMARPVQYEKPRVVVMQTLTPEPLPLPKINYDPTRYQRELQAGLQATRQRIQTESDERLRRRLAELDRQHEEGRRHREQMFKLEQIRREIEWQNDQIEDCQQYRHHR